MSVPASARIYHMGKQAVPQTTRDRRTPSRPILPPANTHGLVRTYDHTTLRWAPEVRGRELDKPRLDSEANGFGLVLEDTQEDCPDSSWTIEAVDSETSEKEEIPDVQNDEEILYPRNLGACLLGAPSLKNGLPTPSAYHMPSIPRAPECPSMLGDNRLLSPSSAFIPPTRKPSKRSSSESQPDQSASLLSNRNGSTTFNKDKTKDKSSFWIYRSLNTDMPIYGDGKGKTRCRTGARSAINTMKPPSLSGKTPHFEPRRAHNTKLSYLPPSPPPLSIQQFPPNVVNTRASQTLSSRRLSKDNLRMDPSPSIAHSLLHGAQEARSGLEDEATVEAAHKLDRPTRKNAWSSYSSTPSDRSNSQFDGINTSGSEKSSPNTRFNSKRGSTSSITYTSSPSLSSASMSPAISVTSMSGTSGDCRSSSKIRRNSASSDISSHSGEAAFLQDRVAFTAVNGEATEESDDIPPVPPLPKDLSTYRFPPSPSSGLKFSTIIPLDDRDKATIYQNQLSRAISLDSPVHTSPTVSQPSSGRREGHHHSTNESASVPPANGALSKSSPNQSVLSTNEQHSPRSLSSHNGGTNIHLTPPSRPTGSPKVMRKPKHRRSSSAPLVVAQHGAWSASPTHGNRAGSSSPHVRLVKTKTDGTSSLPVSQRVRCGFWNRRGDHLMPGGHIVYAPPALAYPAELAGYPPEEEGYQNENGAFRTWAARPELDESLPRMGRAPERPYESFVVYVDQDQKRPLGPHWSSIDPFPDGLTHPKPVTKRSSHKSVTRTATKQASRDSSTDSGFRFFSRLDTWDLDARPAALSAKRPVSPTSSSSSYGSAQSTRSRASSWSNSPRGHIPGTIRDVMEFPFGYPTPN